jgi:hypothetical protein
VRRSVQQRLSTQALPPSSTSERKRELAYHCCCRRSGVATDTEMTEMSLYTDRVCLTCCESPAGSPPLPARSLTCASSCGARCSAAGLSDPPAGCCPRQCARLVRYSAAATAPAPAEVAAAVACVVGTARLRRSSGLPKHNTMQGYRTHCMAARIDRWKACCARVKGSGETARECMHESLCEALYIVLYTVLHTVLRNALWAGIRPLRDTGLSLPFTNGRVYQRGGALSQNVV